MSTAGADAGQADLLARRVVAVARRESTRRSARTLGPADDIPYNVTRVFGLYGNVWGRSAWARSLAPGSPTGMG